MAGKFLRLRQAGPVPQQLGDVCVTPCRVEVGDALLRLVGDSDPLQVLLHHQPGPPLGQLRKEGLVWVHTLQPFLQKAYQFWMERQNVGPAVL